MDIFYYCELFLKLQSFLWHREQFPKFANIVFQIRDIYFEIMNIFNKIVEIVYKSASIFLKS